MLHTLKSGNTDQYLQPLAASPLKIFRRFSPGKQPSNSEQRTTYPLSRAISWHRQVSVAEANLIPVGHKQIISHFLFLLHLRDPAVQQMKSIECLVRHFYKQDKEAESHLLKDGRKSVTILLDGYDELPAELRQNSFIVRLLQHKVLPSSVIVVSSRPHASTHLRNNVTCRVEILGFSEEDQTHFIKQSLEGREEEISHLNKYLTTHPTIASLCFVPFNMTILLFLYKEQATLPTSSANLYKLFISLTICRHLAKLGETLDNDITVGKG